MSQSATTASTATPEKPVRIAVVGLGMGKGHVKNFQHAEGCELVAVCDTLPARLNTAQQDFGVSRTFSDAQELFDSGEVDAVSIATPNFTHHPLTMAALNAGLHVLCEKPLALNAQQAQEMVDLADQKGLRLAVHFNNRSAPPVQAIAQYARSGELGEIYFARSVWHRRKGIPAGATGWFFNKQQSGGGCLIDLGVHMLDMTLYLMDFPAIASVSGQVYNQFGHRDVVGKSMDVEDFATAYLRTQAGATIAMEISWASHHEQTEQIHIALYGTEGGAVRRIDAGQPEPVTILRREHETLTTTQLEGIYPHGLSVQQDFVHAIQQGREPAYSGRQGLLAMRILDAIYQSADTGREVRLDG